MDRINLGTFVVNAHNLSSFFAALANAILEELW